MMIKFLSYIKATISMFEIGENFVESLVEAKHIGSYLSIYTLGKKVDVADTKYSTYNFTCVYIYRNSNT